MSGQTVADQVRELVRDVPDFPKPGIVFKDLTPVFLHGATYRAITMALADRYRAQKVDALVAIESRGFLLAAPLAVELGIGLVMVRKPGKLPRRTISRSYMLEYGSDTLEMHDDALKTGMNVVVVDDLLATGGTARATVDLVMEAGAKVVESAFIVELAFLQGRKRLENVPCHSIVVY